MLRKLIKILTSRIVVLALLLIAQVAFLFISLYRTALSYSLVPLFDLLARILAIYVINKEEDSQYKIGWIFLILALPVLVLYIFMGKYLISGQMSGAVTAS